MKLFERIKYERKRQKMTLIQLSKLASISYGMLYRLEEGGILEPNPDLIKSISKPLGLDYQQVLREYGYLGVGHNLCGGEVASSLVQHDVYGIDDVFVDKPKSIGVFEGAFQLCSSKFFSCSYDRYFPFLKKDDVFALENVTCLYPQHLYFIKMESELPCLMIAKKEKGVSVSLRNVQYMYHKSLKVHDFSCIKRLSFCSHVI
jgi:transcriptional regulator with XRE-family HTH domain